MSKRNWVCFDCRTAVRREQGTVEGVPCALCSKPLVNLGYKIPIPRKRNVRQWEDLRTQIIVEDRECWKQRRENERKEKLALEKEIARLESLPTNPGRAKAVRQLRKLLAIFGAQ